VCFQVYLALGSYGDALADSNAVCSKSKCAAKALYRGASAALLLGHSSDALAKAQYGLSLVPEVRNVPVIVSTQFKDASLTS
jgi:hypothetical protein